MTWKVEFTDEFEQWWDSLDVDEQESVDRYVLMLKMAGVGLDHPYSSHVSSSKYGVMRELRVQHEGRPYRVLYAFDPRRVGMLLIGGDKTGNLRWYEEFVPKADKIYSQHLNELRKEGWI